MYVLYNNIIFAPIALKAVGFKAAEARKRGLALCRCTASRPARRSVARLGLVWSCCIHIMCIYIYNDIIMWRLRLQGDMPMPRCAGVAQMAAPSSGSDRSWRGTRHPSRRGPQTSTSWVDPSGVIYDRRDLASCKGVEPRAYGPFQGKVILSNMTICKYIMLL